MRNHLQRAAANGRHWIGAGSFRPARRPQACPRGLEIGIAWTTNSLNPWTRGTLVSLACELESGRWHGFHWYGGPSVGIAPAGEVALACGVPSSDLRGAQS
jgi:hypothetical protein